MLSSTVTNFDGISLYRTPTMIEGNVGALPRFYLNITPIIIDAQVFGTSLHRGSHKAPYRRLFPSFSQYVSSSLFTFDAHK